MEPYFLKFNERRGWWHTQYMLEEIEVLLQSFVREVVTYFYKDENAMADFLASEGRLEQIHCKIAGLLRTVI